MTDKVHGFASAGQAITGGLDFFRVATTLDITPLAETQPGTYAPQFTAGTFDNNYQDVRVVDSQFRFDKLIETIATRAQPVIISEVKQVAASDDDKKALPSATGNVFEFIFAVDKPDAWDIRNSDPDINGTINGVLDFVSTVPAAKNNIVITRVGADDAVSVR